MIKLLDFVNRSRQAREAIAAFSAAHAEGGPTRRDYMTVARFLTSPGGITLAEVATRPGGLDDADRVVSMHHRCSAESIYRRYHAPLPRLSLRLAERLLQPTGGWSLVAERAGRVVGLTCAGPLSGTDLEVGLLVEDAEQQRGLGARMLREVANEA
jgi:hypothetical protein